MITIDSNGNKTLDIFENFSVDYNLPKFKKEKHIPKRNELSISSDDDVEEVSEGSSGAVTWNTGFASVVSVPMASGTTNPWSRNDKPSTVKGLFSKLKLKVKEWKAEEPEVVFNRIFGSKQTLSIVPTRTVQFDLVLKTAIESGQTALVEKLKKSETIVKIENILHATDFKNFVSEEHLIQFTEGCKRGLRLDWIRNFTRIIPQRVLDVKRAADHLKIFDNYVVLHFDPQGKSTQLTEEEIRRKKDPILFGVFSQSRRLYFIGDWKDEICDLTFDQLVEKLGKDALTL